MKKLLAKIDWLLGLFVNLLGYIFIAGVLSIWALVLLGLVANLKKLL
jgi:hypothetical protein